MDNYRIINKELTQRNQELRQTIGILTKEKSDLMQKVLALEQMNFNLKKSFNTILEATQSYSGVLQGVYSDYQTLLKRSTGSWCSNSTGSSKRSQHFRDTTNLSNRRTFENVTKNSNESATESVEQNCKSKQLPIKTAEIDKENEEEPIRSPIMSKFVNTRKKRTVAVAPISKEMDADKDNIPPDNDFDDSPVQSPQEKDMEDAREQNEAVEDDPADDDAGGLYPIPEESTIQSELSVTVVRSECENISGIDSLPEDMALPEESAKLALQDLSKRARKTSYKTSLMQLTNVDEEENEIEDFSLSKISSSTPYKRRKSTSNIHPKVVIKRLSKSIIGDITGNTNSGSRQSIDDMPCDTAASIDGEAQKSLPTKKLRGKKRGYQSKAKSSKSPTTKSNQPNHSLGELVNTERPRRRAAPISLAEPTLKTKLRKK